MGKKKDDPLGPYRRVRKPVPPPGRTIPDRRRMMEEERARRETEEARREAEEARGGGQAPPETSEARRRRMEFADRGQAGRELAEALERFAREDVVVLSIPRGGVEVGAEVARARGWPLDVVIPRKVGAPHNPELGLGAIAPGVRVLDRDMLQTLRVSEEYLEREIAAQEEEIRRRSEAYRRGRPPADLKGKVAIVVDDGVATGGTAAAALRWARAQGAARVVLAVPVAPREAAQRLAREAEEVVCLATPEPFYAVGQWYREFPQTSDEEVIALLDEAAG